MATDVTQCLFDSQTLARNINVPEGTQAHHIIPIEVIKEALQRTRVIDLEEFDQAWNGIALPGQYGTIRSRLPQHYGSHNNYTEAIKEYIKEENIVNIVLDLDYARSKANYFRAIIEDFYTQDVTHIDDIKQYYTRVGYKAMTDFVRMTKLELKQQYLQRQLEEFQQEYPNRRYNKQRFQLTSFEQYELNKLYENNTGEELLEEEKEYILGVVGEEYIIRNLSKETDLSFEIGKRLRGFYD